MSGADVAALRNLRAAVLDRASRSRDHLRLVDEDAGAVKGRPRCAFTARWRDGGSGATVHSLYVVELARPGDATWAVTGVSDKRWTCRMVPPGERSSVVGVLHAAGLEEFTDFAGVPMTDNFLYRNPKFGYNEQTGKQLAQGVQDKDRTTALLIVSEKARGELEGWLESWWGTVTTMFVSENTLRDMNAALPPSRAIPPGGGRLFVAGLSSQADQVFDAEALDQEPLVVAALQQVFSLRQQTPLPAALIEDATIAEWWTSHPADILLEQQRATMQADLDRLGEELSTARRRAEILTTQRETMQGERDQLLNENTRLQEKLAATADSEDSATVAQLRSQLAATETELDLAAGALAEVEAERDDLARVRGALARAVAAHAGEQVAEIEDHATVRPEHPSFSDLLAHAAEAFPGLAITADPGTAAGLDHHPKATAWRRKTWDALATLNAYVEDRRAVAAGDRESGSWSNDVLSYIKAGEPGAVISANSVSLGESDGVMTSDRLRQARVFPVPETVDQTRQKVFVAHVRIERFKAPAPRLYFLDDVSGTGVVYVGYIGPHLPTQRTN